MTPFVPLEEMIEGSDRLHAELAGHLAAEHVVTDHRQDLASVLSTLVIEHAHSILLLVMEDKPSSALALVRVQYEACSARHGSTSPRPITPSRSALPRSRLA